MDMKKLLSSVVFFVWYVHSVLGFIPYGEIHGDTILPYGRDISTPLENLEVPLVFFNTYETEIYVSTKGLISFRNPFSSNDPETFTQSFTQFDDPIIAPLWGDFFNFEGSGSNMFSRVTNSQETLEMVATQLRTVNQNFTDYNPTLAVIVTWELVILKGRLGLTYTFQAALSTDGKSSFASFSYISANFQNNFRVGFKGRGNRHSNINIDPLILTEDETYLYRIDGECITNVEPGGVCLLNSFALQCVESDIQLSAVSCACDPGLEHSLCLNFIQYGGRAGDTTIQIANGSLIHFADGTNGSLIHLQVPLLFLGSNYSILNILTNGAVYLGRNESDFHKDELSIPHVTPFSRTSPILDLLSIHYRITNDTTTMLKVANMIRTYSNIIDFYPSEATIITMSWANLNFTLTIHLSFVQCVIATDGISSFVLNLYENLQFIDQLDPNDYMIEFYEGQDSSYNVYTAEIVMSLQEKNLYRIDGKCITTGSPGDVCSLNSVATECSNLTASRCECNIGFDQQDNLTCIDINECQLEGFDDCVENSTCTNNEGSFLCECNAGLSGNGMELCKYIDECAQGLDYCNESNMICINSIRGFTCECAEGYVRQDGACEVDECISQPCNANSRCINTEGSFLCTCNEGFSGDGILCEDIDECAQDLDLCNQSSNMICNNSIGGFTCECAEGYVDQDGACEGQSSSSSNSISGIVGGCVAALVLGLLVFAIIVVFYLRHRYKRNLRRKRKAIIVRSHEDNYCLRNLSVQSSFKHNLPKSLIVASCNLQLGKSIGQGEFGIVYKGQLKRSFTSTSSETVAVKTLKGFVQKELIKDLLKECAKMYEFDHPNVLKLSGVCLDGGPAPYIIMPFMENGSLLSYLREERETVVLDLKSSSSEDEEIYSAEKKLLDMCLQVGKGMEYLSSKRIVHRDLATRNCMIDLHFVIKVADFGLAESMDTTKEYFRQDNDVAIKLPIKWLAPESINDGVFSEKSDVWSYGVTCWEIFSGGKTPYAGIHPVDLPRQLDEGLRMEKPVNAACSDDIYSWMKKCWETQADQRPTFSELVSQLTSQLMIKAEYLDFS